MAENLDKWPSKRGPISKIRPSDGCRRDAVPSAMERRYDFPEFGGYLGNVGPIGLPANPFDVVVQKAVAVTPVTVAGESGA